jgi:hypothetical protein
VQGTTRTITTAAAACAVLLGGCSGEPETPQDSAGTDTSVDTVTGEGDGDDGVSTSGAQDDDTGDDSGGTGDTDDGTDTGGTDVVCGDLDGVEIPLAPLPELQAVTGVVRGGGVSLALEPFEGARDYRVYALPSAEAIVDGASGLHVQDAIYRCAGDRMAPDLPYSQNGFLTVDAQLAGDVLGYSRPEEESTLGWVFNVEAEGRVPVHQLGSPEPGHDGACFAGHYAVTRVPYFTTDAAERDMLLAEGWRDDGIAFWTSTAADRPVHLVNEGEWLYYASDGEIAARGPGQIAFDVLAEPTEGAVALRRFTIWPCGGIGHDVLAAGEPRFQRAFQQGAQPVWELEWPSLQPGEILVVEALDAGCPNQGHLSARAVPPIGYAQAFVTMEDVAAGSEYGEVFVNGQHDPASNPQPIARSFVCPEPTEPDAMDFFEEFAAPLDLAEVSMETFGGWNLHLESDRFFASFYSIEPDAWGVESVLGELWVTYADWASDTNGKFRLTPKETATIAADGFLHATVEVDLWSTGRRYPQLWVSSAPSPVQDNMTEGVTINLETIDAWPTSVSLQRCDHRAWDVNDQCPEFAIEHGEFDDSPWPPHGPVGEHSAAGVRSRLDLWVSTDRAYVFVDGVAWGCADFAGLLPEGAVSVTYGDTLYHSGVDEPVVPEDGYLDYIRDYQLTETRRHVDNFGFSSGLPAPAWNHDILPCATSLP